MKISDAFPSKYLKSSDLQGRRVTVTISQCVMQDVGDDGAKPCLFFQGKDKGMILNKTNAAVIAGAYGNETGEWIGKPIELASEKVMFRGEMVDGLRAHVPASAAPAPADVDQADLDDDIPW